MPTKSKHATAAPKPCAMTMLFRREVATLLGAAPADIRSLHVGSGLGVEQLACFERVSTTGLQETVQLSRIQGTQDMWVTRTEGGREWFPRSGRVTKRVRGQAEDDDDDEPEPEEQISDRDEEYHVEQERPRRRSKRRGGVASANPRDGDDDCDEFETPAYRPSSSSSTRSRSKAPRKKKATSRRSVAVENDMGMIDENEQLDVFGPRDEDQDQGDETERDDNDSARERGSVHGKRTSKNVAGRRKSKSSSSGLTSKRTTRSSGSCDDSTRSTTMTIRMTEDDLASLCGRVDNLDVQSSVDAESVTGPAYVANDDVSVPADLAQ
ncbi:hypothetical protein OIV83_005916 [Microbotryomycetes sp. JL201]|nr:hypothetical protein OIV83_005916 [Microbotryomycetes sp. JL201]